jgi:hypothetical protein
MNREETVFKVTGLGDFREKSCDLQLKWLLCLLSITVPLLVSVEVPSTALNSVGRVGFRWCVVWLALCALNACRVILLSCGNDSTVTLHSKAALHCSC